MIRKMAIPLALAAATIFAARPAVAQHGHGRGHDDDRGAYTQSGGDEHPGWCRGRGNPHNTAENCGGYTTTRNYTTRTYTTRRYVNTTRYNTRYNTRYTTRRYTTPYTYRTTSRSRTTAYNQWLAAHNRQCTTLRRERPLDLRWQAQVRQQCATQLRAARIRYGIR